MDGDRQITLTEAAHRLSMSWERAWRALLSGYLEGEKRDGRWFVSVSSVSRYERQVLGLASEGRGEAP